MRVYLAGKMRGLPRFGFDLFLAAAADLRANGVEVVSPAEMDLELGLDPDVANTADEAGLDMAELLLRDMHTIARPSVSGVALLPNWQDSRGATAERAFSVAIGKGVWRYVEPAFGPIILRDQLTPHPLRERRNHADIWRLDAEATA